MIISGIFSRVMIFIKQNKLIVAFITTHTLFAVFLGRLYALAPDEGGYLYTFNNVYKLPITTTAQSGSGWITAPTIFLWIAYLPAKILNVLGGLSFNSNSLNNSCNIEPLLAEGYFRPNYS